jgi:methionine-rich copper-binding protein CopC
MTPIRRACANLILATVATLGVGAPAMAHAELESSSPADGAELEAVPAVLSFTFGETLIAAGHAITLTDLETGSRFALPEVEVDSRTASVTWPDSAAAGEYRAAYRVVSADGHPISGSITFTIPGADPGPSQTGPAASGMADPAAGHPTGTAAVPAPAGATEENWVLAGVVVVLLAAGLLAGLIRRRRRV